MICEQDVISLNEECRQIWWRGSASKLHESTKFCQVFSYQPLACSRQLIFQLPEMDPSIKKNISNDIAVYMLPFWCNFQFNSEFCVYLTNRSVFEYSKYAFIFLIMKISLFLYQQKHTGNSLQTKYPAWWSVSHLVSEL